LMDGMEGQQQGGEGENDDDKIGRGDWARGKGRASGFREEIKDKGEKFTNSKVASKFQEKGAAAIVGEIDGPNAVGKARIKIEGEFKATDAQQSDPLTGARLPKEYREHVGDYFDKLREGEKAAKPKTPEAQEPKE